MSFELPEQRANVEPRVRWQAAAFLIEAMLLLLFITISMVVLISLYSTSVGQNAQSADLSKAVALATNAAERFSAHPADAAGREQVGDFDLECTVTDERRAAGTMYHAQISVYKHPDASGSNVGSGSGKDELVYQIRTARYESGA